VVGSSADDRRGGQRRTDLREPQLWAWQEDLDLGYELKGSLNLSPPITETTQFKN
jgi:hypothetical protein